MRQQTGQQLLAAHLEDGVLPRLVGWGFAGNPFDDDLDVGFRQRVAHVDPVQHVEAAEARPDHGDLEPHVRQHRLHHRPGQFQT